MDLSAALRPTLITAKSVINSFARELQLGGVDTFLERIWTASQKHLQLLGLTTILQQVIVKGSHCISMFILTHSVPPEKERNIVEKAEKLQKKIKAKSPLNKPEADLRKQFFIKGSLGWATTKELWQQNEKLLGLFVLVSSSVSSAAEALRIYRQRDIVEKNFNNLQRECSGRRMRCQESALEGKVFVLFLSLIFADEFKNAFPPGKRRRKLSGRKSKIFA